MNGAVWIAMWSGAFCILIGLVGYNWLYWQARADLSGLTFRETLGQLFSHLPDDSSAAWPHILSGVSLAVGVSLVGGFALEGFAAQFDSRVPTGIGATLAGSIFGAEIGAVAFWTLWQTKRIERGQGVMVLGFSALITAMSREMNSLWNEIEQSQWIPQSHHRFLLVTTNPWFGMLSHPSATATIEFKEKLARLALATQNCRATNGPPFRFGILMGNPERVRAFHENYFTHLTDEAARSDAVDTADKKLDGFVRELVQAGAYDSDIMRKASVPAFQFAVIGGVVFEFILDTVDGATEVRRARILRERLLCERFVQTYGVLRELP